MATLVLSSLGTLVGGPLGGALGALVGREIDGRVLGPRREGPRLQDLKLTGSSYGQPIARHYGKVRAPGTIVWATDLKESSEKSGGGKGRPKTTSYSYSISFAVLLSSRPIDRIGRIWADGNLLRGASGDLKTAGQMRLYLGHGDQKPDPLMAAALGARCPAYRGCAYAVFEDLALADFGNRIPALSFEIFAGAGSALIPDIARQAGIEALPSAAFSQLEGFSHEGGTLGEILGLVDRLAPLEARLDGTRLTLASAETNADPVGEVPPAAAWDEGEFAPREGTHDRRRVHRSSGRMALRYYDDARDYQPGLQRPVGGNGTVVEFPGVLSAAAARQLVDRADLREQARRDTLGWRVAAYDSAIMPGAIVTVPDRVGWWRVDSWEMRPGGIELQLSRHLAARSASSVADPGANWTPRDRLAQQTLLRAFELPWDGRGSSRSRQAFIAASAATGRWSGAALYTVQDGALAHFGEATAPRAVLGHLAAPLAPSQATRIDRQGELVVQLADEAADLSAASPEGLARGLNRARVGTEILQFCNALPLGGGKWRLTGLLRGRGGSEARALSAHPAGAPFTLLDDRLIAIPDSAIAAASGGIAAIGLADEEPVLAVLEGQRASLRPLMPVHPRLASLADGSRHLTWIRRARGGWDWPDDVEQPLAEESERYQIGVGPLAAPLAQWLVEEPLLAFPADQWAALGARFPGDALWVRQCGQFGKSAPLLLARLP